MNRCYFDQADFQNSFVDTLKAVLNYVGTIVKAGGQSSKVVVLTVGKSNSAEIERLMKQYLGMTKSGGAYRIDSIPLNIVFQTTRNYRAMQGTHDVVISCDLGSSELLQLENDNQQGIDEFIHVKDFYDISLWGKVWGVRNCAVPGKSFAMIAPGPRIQHALDQISGAIGLYHTHAFHPSDEEFVKTCVLALHHFLGIINSDEVYAYVIRECHWPLGLANLLKGYFDILNNGRYFRGGEKSITRWKKLYANW